MILLLSVLLQAAAPTAPAAKRASAPAPKTAVSVTPDRKPIPLEPNPAPAPINRWSILLPTEPDCPKSPSKDEIIVCSAAASTDTEQRLPLPGERPPQDRPRQPTGDPRAALDNAGPPCPPGGCTGVDLLTVPVVLIRGIGALIDPHSCCENGEGKDPLALVRDIGRKFGKKPDKSNRVPIVLEEPVK